MDFFRISPWKNRFTVGTRVMSGSFILSPHSYALTQKFVSVKEIPSIKEEILPNFNSISAGLRQENPHGVPSSKQFHLKRFAFLLKEKNALNFCLDKMSNQKCDSPFAEIALADDALYVPDYFLKQKETAFPVNFDPAGGNTSLGLNTNAPSGSFLWVVGGTLMSLTTVALVAVSNITLSSEDTYASNLAPHLTLLDTISIYENSGGVILTADAWDPEGGAITFTLRGEDSSLFHMDSASGALSVQPDVTLDFDAVVDYNSDNQFTLIVVASDSLGASSEAVLTIQLLNVDDEAPEISAITPTLSVDEGSTGQLTDISFIDDGTEPSNAQWILSGVDKDLFHLSEQGVLSIHTPLDYENAQDANMDNVYEVNVQALDSTAEPSNSLGFQIAVNNVWEPGSASMTLNMPTTIATLQSGFNIQFLDEISFTSSVLHRDMDGDGDRDGLLIFADNNGTAATGQQPSIMVAAFDDPFAMDLSSLLFSYQDSGHNYENIRSVSAVRSVGGEQGHQVTINTATLQTKLFMSDETTNQTQPTSKVEKAVNQILLHFDIDNNGIYEGFWQLDSTGLHKGGGDDSSATTLISNELTLVDGNKYATADLDGNAQNDIIVYTPSIDSISVWLSDENGHSMALATANNNPMYGAKLSTFNSASIAPSDIHGFFWFKNLDTNNLAVFNDSCSDIFTVS